MITWQTAKALKHLTQPLKWQGLRWAKALRVQAQTKPMTIAEVISPNDKVAEITGKRRKYIEAGILFWELYPDERLIDVYAPGKALATYGMDAAIVVDVISVLTIPVSKLFR